MQYVQSTDQSSLEPGRDDAEDLAYRLAKVGEVLSDGLPHRAMSRVGRRTLVDDGLPALLQGLHEEGSWG